MIDTLSSEAVQDKTGRDPRKPVAPRPEWLTIAEAARRLGMSAWTVRRWIAKGKLYAELRRGAHGHQYYVHSTQVTTAREIGDRIGRYGGAAESASTLKSYLKERDGNVVGVLQRLQGELAEAARRKDPRESQLREEIEQIRREMAAGILALRRAQPGPEPTRQEPGLEVEPSRRWWRPW